MVSRILFYEFLYGMFHVSDVSYSNHFIFPSLIPSNAQNENIFLFIELFNSLYVLRILFLVHVRNTVNGDPRWCCTYLLDPSDPLFVELGAAFIKRQIEGVFYVHCSVWLLSNVTLMILYIFFLKL